MDVEGSVIVRKGCYRVSALVEVRRRNGVYNYQLFRGEQWYDRKVCESSSQVQGH